MQTIYHLSISMYAVIFWFEMKVFLTVTWFLFFLLFRHTFFFFFLWLSSLTSLTTLIYTAWKIHCMSSTLGHHAPPLCPSVASPPSHLCVCVCVWFCCDADECVTLQVTEDNTNAWSVAPKNTAHSRQKVQIRLNAWRQGFKKEKLIDQIQHTTSPWATAHGTKSALLLETRAYNHWSVTLLCLLIRMATSCRNAIVAGFL